MNKQSIKELEGFIKSKPDARELKRALAIKMYQGGMEQGEIAKILSVSQPFVSKWSKLFKAEGLSGIKLRHQGSKGYLDKKERSAVICWIKNREHLTTKALKEHVREHYGVEYNSWQSYCNLLAEAEYSHKKSQKMNPKRDEQQVKKNGLKLKKF